MRLTWVGICIYTLAGCCDGSDDDSNGFVDEDIPAAVRAFQTVAAQQQVDLPDDGVVPGDVVIDNGAGICLRIDAGTTLRRGTGELLSGPLDIGFDDGAPDVQWLEDTIGEALGGSIRVWARLPGETEMLDIVFDPPATVELKSLGQYSGEWRFEQYDMALGRSAVTGAGPGEPPSGTRWEFHDWGAAVRPEGDGLGSGQILVKVSTLTGAWLNDSTLPPQGFECAGEVIFTRILGPVGSDNPRVCCLSLINPRTGQKVAANCWFPGLFFPGQSRVIGPDRDIEVRIVERDGNRVVEVCSPYKNEFIVRLSCCDWPELADFETKEFNVAGSDDEQDEDGPYLGAIEVKIIHWGGIGEFFRTRNTLEAAHARTDHRWLRPLGGGRYLSCFTVRGFNQSVRRYAALLPQSWQFRYLERRIEVNIPCPPPTVVTSAPGATTVDVIDPETLGTIRTSDVLPGVADKVVVLPDDLAIVVTAEMGEIVSVPGALHRVDLATGAVLDTMSMPGLHTAVATNQLGDRLFVATADGILRVLDPLTFGEIMRVEGLPPGRYGPIACSIDGGCVYLAAPAAGGPILAQDAPPPPSAGLLQVNLLQRTIKTAAGTITITVRGVSPAPDGRFAVRDTDDGIRVIENGIADPIDPGDFKATTFHWTPDNELVVGSEQNVRVYTSDLMGSVSITSTSGASSIITYTNGDGNLEVVGVRPTEGELFRSTRTGPNTYSNPLGVAAPAITDTSAFATVQSD